VSGAEAALAAAALLGGLAAVAGVCLGLLARRLPADSETLIDRIDALLPQTQCAQCGHPGCRPYARAIADGGPIDACPPGGAELVVALAALLGRSASDDRMALRAPAAVARIDETSCIGCALCLPACPVDAIVGAKQFLHTVLEAECTGCGLCLPPCPVDCITLEPRDRAPRLLAAEPGC
jgi:electron transport complex protein RnfB